MPGYAVAIPGIVGPRFVGFPGLAAAPAPADVPDRRDHSVNGAWVDGWNQTGSIFRTQTNTNPIGGYTGTGTGNKAILGHFLPAPLALAALAALSWTTTDLQPEGPAGSGIPVPYGNLVVELAPGLVAILVVGDSPTTGTFTPLSATQTRVDWTPGGNLVRVVNGKGMALFPNPPGPVFVPTTPPLPVQPSAAAWTGFAYAIADILAFYPGATILNVDPLDGGEPALTILSGVTLCAGDSANHRQHAIRLDAWSLNGSAI